MLRSLRNDIDLIADPSNLDTCVEEVFATMLSLECLRGTHGSFESPESETITVVVGFGGALSGGCIISSDYPTAFSIASAMTDSQHHEMDETVKDAIGELCNVLAGDWKSRYPGLASHCGLSVPVVITGGSYSVRLKNPVFEIHRIYRADRLTFSVSIICESLQ